MYSNLAGVQSTGRANTRALYTDFPTLCDPETQRAMVLRTEKEKNTSGGGAKRTTRSSFKKPAASPHNANSTTPDPSTGKRRRVQEVLPDAEEGRGEGCTTTDTEDYTQDVVDDDLQGMQVPLTTLLSILSTHHLKGEASSKKVKRKVKKLEETVDDLRDRYAYLHRKLAAQPQQVCVAE